MNSLKVLYPLTFFFATNFLRTSLSLFSLLFKADTFANSNNFGWIRFKIVTTSVKFLQVFRISKTTSFLREMLSIGFIFFELFSSSLERFISLQYGPGYCFSIILHSTLNHLSEKKKEKLKTILFYFLISITWRHF